ncbi:MAG: hypothetical protein WA990_06355 [Rubrobacteraceae bacterium]
MNSHWRLALVYAAAVVAASALISLAVFFAYGGSYSVALLYGVFVGILSFVSTALTVSLLMNSSTSVGMMVGGASFAARLGFAAGALGIPAYLNLWPVVMMLAGFAAVYLAENVLLVPVLLGKKVMDVPGAEPVSERIERSTEV